MTRCQLAAARKAEKFPTHVACRVVGVTRQGFYLGVPGWQQDPVRQNWPKPSCSARYALCVSSTRGKPNSRSGLY